MSDPQSMIDLATSRGWTLVLRTFYDGRVEVSGVTERPGGKYLWYDSEEDGGAELKSLNAALEYALNKIETLTPPEDNS